MLDAEVGERVVPRALGGDEVAFSLEAVVGEGVLGDGTEGFYGVKPSAQVLVEEQPPRPNPPLIHVLLRRGALLKDDLLVLAVEQKDPFPAVERSQLHGHVKLVL